MKTIFTFAILGLALVTLGAADSFADGRTKLCEQTSLPCDGDVVDTDTTKNLNGRVGQAAALASVSFAEVSTPGERLNLTMQWSTNDLGGPGAAGGGVLVNLREVDDNLYVGFQGGHSFEGGGSIVGIGVRWAVSPF